jgi:hypothetical protein
MPVAGRDTGRRGFRPCQRSTSPTTNTPR